MAHAPTPLYSSLVVLFACYINLSNPFLEYCRNFQQAFILYSKTSLSQTDWEESQFELADIQLKGSNLRRFYCTLMCYPLGGKYSLQGEERWIKIVRHFKKG